MESPHKALGRLLAQQASEDALRDEEEGKCNLTSFQELQILLSSRDEVSCFLVLEKVCCFVHVPVQPQKILMSFAMKNTFGR